MTDDEIRERAVEEYASDEVIVADMALTTDANPVVERVDGGAWVEAYLWVGFQEGGGS